jgi:hypothetical protein
MAAQSPPFAGNPIWTPLTVQVVDQYGNVSPQDIQILPQTNFDSYLQRITQALAGVTGFQGQPANINGDLSMNGNTISGLTNSSPPGADEALTVATAEQLFDTRGLVAVSSAYTAPTTVRTIIAIGTFTVSLTTSGLEVDQTYRIKNAGTGTITVQALGSAQIDGAGSYQLTSQYQFAEFVWDGSNLWRF